MQLPQYRDAKGKWITIPTMGIPDNAARIAHSYCVNNKLQTRVVETTIEDGKEVTKTIREFRMQKH